MPWGRHRLDMKGAFGGGASVDVCFPPLVDDARDRFPAWRPPSAFGLGDQDLNRPVADVDLPKQTGPVASL